MSDTLICQTGRATGSANSRRLRAEGRIPAVIYGHGMTPVSVSVDRRDLRLALLGPAGFNTLLNLGVDGATYPAIIKDLQRHPIKRTVSHIDFMQVDMNEELTVHVTVRLEGEAKAVLSEGGLVDPAVDSIEVRCTPKNMPAEVVIDITNMQLGDVIRLGDLSLPKGVTAHGDPEMPVVTALGGTTEADAMPADDEVEGGEAAGDAGDE